MCPIKRKQIETSKRSTTVSTRKFQTQVHNLSKTFDVTDFVRDIKNKTKASPQSSTKNCGFVCFGKSFCFVPVLSVS